LDAGDWTWANRQKEDNPYPDATTPQAILTCDREGAVTAWNPMTGERLATPGALDWPKPPRVPTLEKQILRIIGPAVHRLDQGRLTGVFQVGHGLRSLAVGDVDGVKGPELITLNAGWVKVWDPKTQSQLLRFYVGPEQVAVQTMPRGEDD